MTIFSTKDVPTLFLKAVIIAAGLVALALCVFLLPLLYRELPSALPEHPVAVYLALAAVTVTPVPFYIALVQGFQLLRSIDSNTAFSPVSLQALSRITLSGVAMATLYALCMPLVMTVVQYTDAPGLGVIGLTFVMTSVIVATFAVVLQKLIHSGIEMKAENDLTI